MKISDLKSGEHFVKLRNGDIAIVIGMNLFGITEYVSLENYNEDMTYDTRQNLDITKVYQVTDVPRNLNLYDIWHYFKKQVVRINNNELDIIWERTDKIELTDAERVILENIDKTYQWIARDKEGLLCVFSDKPTKHEDKYWYFDDDANCDFFSINVFQHIFQSIQWSDDEPKYIPDLLKGKKNEEI